MTVPSAESMTAVITDAGSPRDVAPVLAAAVDLARSAVAECSGAETVGDHLGVDYEDQFAATHRFHAQLPGYRGWQWVVVVAAHPGAHRATVSEVALIPGPTALLAPEWVPWQQRIRPGDLGPGDMLAPAVDDLRLVPGYAASGDPLVDDVAVQIGLGRRWVLSADGRSAAAQRWHDGDYGPGSAMARSTKRVCRTCGFFLPLAGALGPMFGVCANVMSADGHVVDAGYGCGAHSDTPAPAGVGSPAHEPYDDGLLDVQDAVAPVESEQAESEQAEPEQAEPGQAESEQPESEQAEPGQAESEQAEPEQP